MRTVDLLKWGPAYLETERVDEAPAGSVALLGVPYDATTSYRPGARFGADALRAASDSIESYCPHLDRDMADLHMVDLGNLVVPNGNPQPMVVAVEAAITEILEAGARPIMLGGEHSVTSGAVKAVAAKYPDLLVVQFDAHADLRPEYLGETHSHASAMARSLDHLQADGLLQVGIRSGTREEFAEMRAAGRLVTPNAAALKAALDARPDRPVYITVDLDVFDPGCFPGTGTPEAGGIFWPDWVAMVNVLATRRVVAADVVELSPPQDPTGISPVHAAKVVRSLALILERA